jgi:hypothetical protein
MGRDSASGLALFVFSVVDGFEFVPVFVRQSSGKAKKLCCDVSQLAMLRESSILVSS